MDARVVRTKKIIREAFFELLNEKDMADITLTELSLRANVNRQTLYNYYHGVHDILDDIITTLFDHYKKVIYKVDVIHSFETPMIIFNKINSILSEDIEFYKKLFTMKHNLFIKTYMSNELANIIKDVFKKYQVFNENDVDIITTYFVHGLMGCYQYYFDHDYLNLNEYSEKVCDIVFNGLKKQINK